MSTAILIALFFSIGFFVESIVGLGGTLIAYALLSFFIDIKEMIIAALYIATCSSIYIIYTDAKSFSKTIFLKSLPMCIIGTICGALIFSKFDSRTLSLILGLLLIFLATQTFFFNKITLPKIFKNKLLFIGGASHGAFGIGGPFIVNALYKDFNNKSQLRTTLAIFFVAFNLERILQLSLQGQINFDFIKEIWWVMLPVGFAIYLGYKAHLIANEQLLKKAIAILTFFGGIKFLTQFFS